jgi:SulP family sulfate permease
MSSKRETRLADLLAGWSVALVLIPQGMAYAELAGLPAHRGLYAGALPLIIAAFFASSRYLQTGPSALTSLLTFGALSSIAVPGSDEYIGLAALMAVVVGSFRVIIGAIGAGSVSYLLSLPVLRGFTLGASVLIGASQLPALAGITASGSGVLSRAVETISMLSSWEPMALIVSVVTLFLILGGRRIHALFPGVLVAVIAGVAYSHFATYPGPTVGEVPASWFPPLSVDLPWGRLPDLLLSGFIIALVGFAEAATVAQLYAEREKQVWRPNREFISQGAANLVAGVSGGFPVGGSFSRSALAHLAGARTQLAGGITGVALLLLLPLAWMIGPLPKAVLGATVVAGVLKLLNPTPLIEVGKLSPPQAIVGVGTFVLTLVLAPHIEYAVIAGIALSLVVHIWREQYFKVDVDYQKPVLHLRPEGVIWFASTPMFRETLAEAVAAHPEADSLVVHLDRVGRIDLSGAIGLREVANAALSHDMKPSFVGISPHAKRVMNRVCGPFCES